MRVGRAALVVVAVAAGAVAVSGGAGTDPRTPRGLPGMPAPFLGTAVVGSGGRTAAVDAYGNVVDLRVPGPAGEALVAVPAERQAAGSVHPRMAIVARAELSDGRELPFWRADSVRQAYVPGTNVLRTEARFGERTFTVVRRIGGPEWVRADRRWLARARPLAADAPPWARRMYERSLLVLRALTDRRSGAVVAGARDGWAYVWPRDAGAVALAFAAAGYREEARRVARFLLELDLGAAARFRGTGEPVPGRDAQGDAAGWVAAAARGAGLPAPRNRHAWRDRADYQEGDVGDFLANAIASTAADGPESGRLRRFQAHRRLKGFVAGGGLVRVADDPESGLDSAAAWGVRPFPVPTLFPAVRRTLLRIVAERKSRYGIVPSQGWTGGEDPWTAPTAWTAWALAALARRDQKASGRVSATSVRERDAARVLMGDLRRAATPLGLLPERVDAESGLPRSTTPLAWSHAFAILALRELWPTRP